MVFALAPVVLGGILLWVSPRTRRVKLRAILLYLVVMGLLIWGALQFVAWIASARVRFREVLLVLWFTIAWRLAWSLWEQAINRIGRRRLRAARWRRIRGQPVPASVRLIPFARAMLTAIVLIPLFLSTVVTHRCKLEDDQDPSTALYQPFEHIRIPTSDGLTLDGWFVPQPDATRTILICHGAGANKGNFVWFLAPLIDRGYNVAFFDFRAHGSSDGRTITYGIHEKTDVLAAVAWLKRHRAAQSEKIVGLGSSQGAFALALAAAEEPRIDAIVLDSPFVSPRELAQHRAKYVPIVGPAMADWMLLLMSLQTGADFFHADAEAAIARRPECPVLVIHGDGDFVMPVEHSERLIAAATGVRELWLGSGAHSNIVTAEPGEYGRHVFELLDKAIGPAPRQTKRRHHPATQTQSQPN